MYFWLRLLLISTSILLWLIEDQALLSNPVYWLTAGVLIAGASSEPLWKTRFYLYSILTFIACLFTYEYQLHYGWAASLVFASFAFLSSRIPLWQIGLLFSLVSIHVLLLSEKLSQFLFSMVVALLVFSFAIFVLRLLEEGKQKQIRIEELAYDQRMLKRQLLLEEDAAKQAERTRIARDVHDSVGHQLTALAMQLQIAELKETGDTSYIIEAKQTARTALEEMRKAVKALEKEEIRGVSMIVRLIRKLEAESQVYISFKTESGALSQFLDDNQSTAVYRFVQEGLTNAMRHAFAKQISVELSIAGGHTYIATVRNEATPHSFVEGFGLTQLRQRFEELDGTFTTGYQDNYFVMRGAFPIGSSKEANHSNC
ncbi:signal transduction histidine kinase [Alkalihalobacillus xiaoxiensis]|uniref:histidine kinase n=1 Tax=Shouchella xiaoxiensis TaxID=766895 RepID=A0ABS2SX10_9BACI|nr:sensor histidine kinase [Shouchella xiaoxiensis]MBM7838989.1 signal transduction histidine kinase [Shouchella xiaoxiensis]